MKIEIIRQKRKTMVLKILDGQNAVLKVPLRLSDKKVQEFLDSKKVWLSKTVQKMQNAENFSKSFDLHRCIYLNGAEFMRANELAIGFDDFPETKKRRIVHKFYLSKFAIIEKLAKDIASKTGLKFKEVVPHNSVRVWGSFSSLKQMKLNWKLVILPQRLVEYVICHELCHGLHMNHSPRFWSSVKKICPDYVKLRKELQNYGFVLKEKF